MLLAQQFNFSKKVKFKASQFWKSALIFFLEQVQHFALFSLSFISDLLHLENLEAKNLPINNIQDSPPSFLTHRQVLISLSLSSLFPWFLGQHFQVYLGFSLSLSLSCNPIFLYFHQNAWWVILLDFALGCTRNILAESELIQWRSNEVTYSISLFTSCLFIFSPPLSLLSLSISISVHLYLYVCNSSLIRLGPVSVSAFSLWDTLSQSSAHL